MTDSGNSNTSESAIIKRLNGLIRLLMEVQNKSGTLKRGEQLLALESAGLTTTDIGVIVGQKPKNVSSTLSKARKERDNQKRKKKIGK